jgi:hypothetical protein
MPRRSVPRSFVVLLLLALLAAPMVPARAAIAPPWCGTPMPDAAENLPDGTEATDPVGSFPHIPYYAIRCTLDEIATRSGGRMTVEVVGKSALGRDMFLVTINALDTVAQRRAFHNWQEVRQLSNTDPVRAMRVLERHGDAIKVPLFIQGGIHGNEYEGVDANMQLIERLATTPYGTDAEVDQILDQAVVLFNVIQNPDGRIAGTRANGNGFDLNRDFLTQSQSETLASVSIMQEWQPPDTLDLHGYVTPTLIEATTKPHNPSIEYDLWLEWNQERIDANEAAMTAAGYDITRPINDWCADTSEPDPSELCDDGTVPGPAVAEGWDDWGPFYTPMYSQHVGLNGSTVEMCNSTGTGCLTSPASQAPRGRLGARASQYIVVWSTLLFDTANRVELLHDELEIYRRGVENAPRPECCPPPFDVANNWMHEYPTAYVIPLGEGQRSDPEANRLVGWLLTNGIAVEELKQAYTFGGQTFEKGSYVVWLTQARRGLADTALSIGVDISDDISILYAPPASWSHGYLWGADTVEIPRDAAFAPITNRVTKESHLLGGVEPGVADGYALVVDSPTAVRTANDLLDGGLAASLATTAFATPTGGTLPAGSLVFAADPGTKARLASVGRSADLWFHRVSSEALPALEPVDGAPRIAVLTAAVNQDVWSLRELGFVADPIGTGNTSQLNNPAAANPLEGYDVVFNTGGWPGGATARARLQAFFAAGGGYIGAGAGGAGFLTNGGQLSGLTAVTRAGGVGRSGIVYWNNEGGVNSPVVGAYATRNTAIMDPPTWFTAVPAALSVDGRFPAAFEDILASGMWASDAQSASAANAPVIVHGGNTAATARLTVFAMNPLYRADPEGEWPMLASAAYWADQ